ALGTLVAGVAHEINNPINLIMFNLPLLQKIFHDFLPILEAQASQENKRKYGGLTYEFLKENLDQLLSDMDMAANRVAKIVGDLKNFSRRSDVSEKKPMEINRAVENAIRLVKTTLRKSQVALELDLGKQLPKWEGNTQGIEQITLNILINAIQAIDHDHGRIKVSTGFQDQIGRLFISVSDNGKGVDPVISDRIFDPFVTDKQTKGGTGLGLSVSYSLVKAHDGEISFISKTGDTTFTVFFPITPTKKTPKILLVDDNESIRSLLREALTKGRGYLVDEVSNGVEACIRLGTSRPDLLILDIFMPEMNGLEVCRAIKNDPEISDINVFITTGFPEHPILEQVAELGFSNIYEKPINLHDFIKDVDRILLES
ncbi:ATP-binding protein, partial [Thermodesulfobacteriota bacterium]